MNDEQIKELVISKLELLLNDLKINGEAEQKEKKSYFSTQLFAIRVKEILKILLCIQKKTIFCMKRVAILK